tara:strand:+ start:96 stop:272 length:177 start_codon:yes stop_codon:yes gene_type:complete
MIEPKECYICDEELTEEYWTNYYACEFSEENTLCGNGDCWAEWMQDNTQSHKIEQEQE